MYHCTITITLHSICLIELQQEEYSQHKEIMNHCQRANIHHLIRKYLLITVHNENLYAKEVSALHTKHTHEYYVV